jgi:hypothetical protein
VLDEESDLYNQNHLPKRRVLRCYINRFKIRRLNLKLIEGYS